MTIPRTLLTTCYLFLPLEPKFSSSISSGLHGTNGEIAYRVMFEQGSDSCPK